MSYGRVQSGPRAALSGFRGRREAGPQRVRHELVADRVHVRSVPNGSSSSVPFARSYTRSRVSPIERCSVGLGFDEVLLYLGRMRFEQEPGMAEIG